MPGERHAGREQKGVRRKSASGQRHRAEEQRQVRDDGQRSREGAQRFPDVAPRQREEGDEHAPHRERQQARIPEAEDDRQEGEEDEEAGCGGAVSGEGRVFHPRSSVEAVGSMVGGDILSVRAPDAHAAA